MQNDSGFHSNEDNGLGSTKNAGIKGKQGNILSSFRQLVMICLNCRTQGIFCEIYPPPPSPLTITVTVKTVTTLSILG